MSSDLCQVFQQLAKRVWRDMSKAKKHNVSFYEETITQNLLLELVSKRIGKVETKAFTKAEEKTNGADWEIWFCGRTRGISIRFQAKRLNEKSGKYGALDGNDQQLETFKCMAIKDKVIPLYLFYNHSGIKKGSSTGSSNNLWGCTVAPVEVIPNINAPSPSDIDPMFPWHVIFCHPSYFFEQSLYGDDLVDLVADKLKEICGGRADQKSETLSENNPFEPRQTPPEWVNQLWRMPESDSDREASSGLEQYLTEKQLGGLLVIRLRE